jgi:hypothetical protein
MGSMFVRRLLITGFFGIPAALFAHPGHGSAGVHMHAMGLGECALAAAVFVACWAGGIRRARRG